MSHELILSSYQNYDKKNNILLLGEWCLNAKNFDLKNKYKICKPYGLESSLIRNDFFICEKTFEFFIEKLKINLNSLHNINFSTRAWKIFIGPWLKRYIRITHNRYQTLSYAIKNYEINKIVIAKHESYDFTTKDTDDIYSASILPEWDYAFFSRIFHEIKNKIEIVERIEINQKFYFSKIVKEDSNLHKSLKIKLFSKISKIFSFLKKNDVIFIKESYLQTINQLTLELMLKQIPIIWNNKNLIFPEKDVLMRSKIKVEPSGSSKLEEIIAKNIGNDLPIYAIEGLDLIKKNIKELNWPEKPKTIFTSNSFWGDEAFKFYTAKNIDKGVKYIVGQHGNSYGTRFTHNHSVEYTTCDKFLTWGHKFSPKDIIGANFCPAIKTNKHDPNGGLLIINRGRPTRTRAYDRHHLFVDYCNDLNKFSRDLNKKIRSKTLIRNRHTIRLGEKDNSYYFKFFNNYPEIKVDNGLQIINNIIKKNRLIFFSYYSTGFLECLTKNIPTICFDKEILNLLNDDSKEDFKKLFKKKIIYNDIIQISNFLNQNWDQIAQWWLSDEVQTTRKIFIQKYSRPGNYKTIKNIAKNLSL